MHKHSFNPTTAPARTAACALAALLLGVAACSRGAGSSNPAESANGTVADTGDPPARAARLSSLDGDVSLEAPGSESWSQPTTNYTVTTGDRLATGSTGRAELDLGNAAMRLDQGADVTVTDLTDHFAQFGVDQGDFDASLYQYDPSDSIEIDTPNGALMPTAAGTYLVSIDPNDNATIVNVESGTLDLTGPGLNEILNAGRVVRLVGTNPIQVVAVTQAPTEFADLDRWRAERDVHWQRTGPVVRYVSESVPGWEDLDDNGQWTVDETNTDVWCPTHVTADYVPYRQGHWSWVDPWGWTWVDDASWGYTTSHYGRWEHLTTSSCNSANDWAWVPAQSVAEPVYAPALVAFVDAAALALNAAPSAQAWFPLGPREAYFPPYHYSDAYLRAVNATNLREVSNVDPLIRVRNVDNVQWANRTTALTVVPATVFRAGDPVMRNAIRLRPAQIAAAPIAPHPSVNPDPQLMAGGRPAARPPRAIASRPQMVVTRAAPHVTRNGRAPRSAAGEVGPPLTTNPPSAVAPGRVAPRTMTTPRTAVTPRAAAPRASRPIITRNAPPAARPSPAARQPAMQAHPGRPLEPQQVQNLRRGRPAGPPRDVEVPAHQPSARVANPPQAAPRPTPTRPAATRVSPRTSSPARPAPTPAPRAPQAARQAAVRPAAPARRPNGPPAGGKRGRGPGGGE